MSQRRNFVSQMMDDGGETMLVAGAATAVAATVGLVWWISNQGKPTHGVEAVPKMVDDSATLAGAKEPGGETGETKTQTEKRKKAERRAAMEAAEAVERVNSAKAAAEKEAAKVAAAKKAAAKVAATEAEEAAAKLAQIEAVAKEKAAAKERAKDEAKVKAADEARAKAEEVELAAKMAMAAKPAAEIGGAQATSQVKPKAAPVKGKNGKVLTKAEAAKASEAEEAKALDGLWKALKNGDAKKAEACLIKCPALVGYADPTHGHTPMHRAAAFASLSCIKLLHHHGASLTTRNRAGRTPLEEAKGIGEVKAVKLFEALAAGKSGDELKDDEDSGDDDDN